ncbi:DUF5994 family protein [Streptomyces sp. NPDC014733]|uniref:DUF5994 family protein n=1 Tax=Streptomyces sp. NPDC014733 TaxID=3364885 RepID=UPI0036F618DD
MNPTATGSTTGPTTGTAGYTGITGSPAARRQPHHAPPPVARLAIAPATGVARRTDGVWWPRSADLEAELTELLPALPFDWPRITHATANGALWTPLPTLTLVAGHVIRLRRLPDRPGPPTLCLVAAGLGRWDLRVLPPRTAESDAVRILAGVATGAIPADAPLPGEGPAPRRRERSRAAPPGHPHAVRNR